ncbi:Nn.00g112800.m01.CDS01 [Neocucurbitaria sp. VM-36]
MAPLDFEELQCERFLWRFHDWVDPTWGFYVYGTYTRPQGQKDADRDSDEANAQEAAIDAHFQAVLSKLHAYAADTLRYSHPAPYNQQLIDTLRLQPAAYLPGASLSDVCTHFRQHHAFITDPDSFHDGLNHEATDNDFKCGPKYDWCLVVDDESLQSIECGPEPIGPTPPKDACPWDLKRNAREVFVKLLSKEYTTMEKPVVLSAQSRSGGGRRIEWNGWLKFSPVMLMQAFEETDSGDPETYFEDPNKLVCF